MGARPVTMTVINYTGQTLVLIATDVINGKFTVKPPNEIKSNGSGSWSCSARDGAMIGPKGTATFEAEDHSFKVEFFWNHPYGSATSAYSVTPDPSDAIRYNIDGDPEGHTQDITFVLNKV
ncbi:hypothetical protein [Reichenbachiella versicolor]|uniref:hypothetical protein n=1 Tax=Reichenbachiella versicolor TaxID=1821036 RepID=UPI000D6E2DFF|nr:hypothetical protein [Reichenbachiella versicolor]